jgi:hypothetical protein
MQSAMANEAAHRHWTHERLWQSWALPHGYDSSHVFAEIEARKHLRARLAGGTGWIVTRHLGTHRLSARPALR